MIEENFILRKLLWLSHGCPPSHLYGDDGEMQCQACLIDFIRTDIEVIVSRFEEMKKQRFIRAMLNRKVNVKIDFELKYDEKAKVHVATAPVLGISSQGEDRWQAEAALADAIEGVFKVCQNNGVRYKQEMIKKE